MIEKIDLSEFLQATPFSSEDLCNFLFLNNCCISLILVFDKAKWWPFFRTRFISERIENIPIVWAILIPKSQTEVELIWDIHPMKCFPSLYISNNSNFSKYKLPLPLEKNSNGSILSGCPRYVVNISGKEYTGSQPEYCSAFGLPDDCFEPNFGTNYIKTLENLKEFNIWFFENNEFLQNNCPGSISKKFMKDEFLPNVFFFYIDNSAQFLSGIFHSIEMAELNQKYWYSNGHDFIKERNYRKSGQPFRFEDSALSIIRNKVICELIRLVLLIQNREKFKAFSIKNTPRYNEIIKNQTENRINEIIADVKNSNEPKLNSIIRSIIPKLDLTQLKRTDFLIMDVEFYNVNYPIKNPLRDARSFKFPCIFSTIYWHGKENTAEIDINVLTLPCHYCEETCRESKKHSMKFNCLFFANSFIKKQITFFEEKLAEVNSLKLYSYGNGDFKQLEHSDNFFINSYNARMYYRKNRKQPFRIVRLAEDISIKDMSLAKVENEILKSWLNGWSRQGIHVNVNRFFSTPPSRPDFGNRYHDAIETCVADSISTFLYLLYRDYRLNDDTINLRQNVQTTLF
jgi:hypothetical protein